MKADDWPTHSEGRSQWTIDDHSSSRVKGRRSPLVEEMDNGRMKKNCEDVERQHNEDYYLVDKVFSRICWVMMVLGVNFHRNRTTCQKIVSYIIVIGCVIINVYYIYFLSLGVMNGPFSSKATVVCLGFIMSALQATISTMFLAYWQATHQSCNVLKKLYAANQGLGIKEHLKWFSYLLRMFYVVVVFIIGLESVWIVACVMGYAPDGMTGDMRQIFGNLWLFPILVVAHIYTLIGWAVALFIFVLLVHATQLEFGYFSQRVRELKAVENDGSDDVLCQELMQLITMHNRLSDCVKNLDNMFQRYAFIMLATIIPTTIFALFTAFKETSVSVRLLFSFPVILFCLCSFIALTSSPSQLHQTICDTKSTLCSNTAVWFPYRPNVYHTALAFVCHIDHSNLGISIWGFAVVSKPFVLTTFSVMVTCLALFLQMGQGSNIT